MMELLGGGLGSALAGAVLLLALRWLPPAPMDLAAAWKHLSHRTSPRSASWGWRGKLHILPDRLVTAADRCEHPWLAIPTADLALLEISPRAYVQRRLRGAGLGTVAGAVVALVPLTAGWGLMLTVMPVTMLAGLVAGALWPAWRVRDAATTARDEAKRALATYVDLVAGERTSGSAPAPALAQAAQLGEHWLFARLHRALTWAHHTGTTPWSALRDLGHQLTLDPLVDIADIADTASEGAAIYDSLTTQAATLRHQTRTTERTAANAASERLTLPTSLLMISFLLLVLYPTAAHLVTP